MTNDKDQQHEANAASMSELALDWNDQGQPISRRYDDIYFSKEDGAAESQYIFIEGNTLAQRWTALFHKPEERNTSPQTFRILELGFGTGLNFILCMKLWQQINREQAVGGSLAKNRPHLHYISIEKHPLSARQIVKALACWPELQTQTQELIRSYPPLLFNGVFRLLFPKHNITLDLHIGDATKALSRLSPRQPEQGVTLAYSQLSYGIDAFFLDGFAPQKNPDMWSLQVFQYLARLSHANTSFATFTTARPVKDALNDSGFEFEKRKGFGKKREMLKGHYRQGPQTKIQKEDTTDLLAQGQHPRRLSNRAAYREKAKFPTWCLQTLTPEHTAPDRVIIIGAGLAGCHAAHALASRGVAVTVVDKAPAIAAGASGNQQGVVYARISPDANALNRFSLCAQIFADHFYSRRHGVENESKSLYERCGQQCGVIHLADTPKRLELYKKFIDTLDKQSNFAQLIPKNGSKELCGVQLAHDGLLISNAGWLEPATLCSNLLKHPLITTVLNRKVEKLEHIDNAYWRLLDDKGHVIDETACVVVANANSAKHFLQTHNLPLKSIRGQVSHLQASHKSMKLSKVICGRGYIPPSHNSIHCIGASFNLNCDNKELRQEDHHNNFEHIRVAIPETFTNAEMKLASRAEGRVGFRSTTPDYLPMVGPATDVDTHIERFGFLKRKANANIERAGASIPGLYVSVGYGSKGLAYTPICSQLLADQICGAPTAIALDLYAYLHPARFITRQLIRNEISAGQQNDP